MNTTRKTVPSFHQDLWVMFALGAALLAGNAWFISWSPAGHKLAVGLFGLYILLGGCGVCSFCALTRNPARGRRSRRRRACAAAKSAVY